MGSSGGSPGRLQRLRHPRQGARPIHINMDAQDNRDGTLLQDELAPAMIRHGLAGAWDFRTTDFQKQSCIS